MPRIIAYECEHCHKKSLEFGDDWLHFKHILFSKGKYTEERDYQNYLNYGNITFCSYHCFAAFMQKILNAASGQTSNPSSRVIADEL